MPIGFNISLEEFAESIETRAWQSVATQNPLPFEEARAFMRGLGLKNTEEWRAYSKSGKRPANIPGTPHVVYAENGWTNWGDWLGTGNVQNGTIPLLPFEEARAFVRDLGLKDTREWRAYSKSDERPDNIPSNPNDAYAEKGWTNWGDWIGTGNIRSKTFLPFEEARAFAHKLGLKVQTEWQAYSKSSERPPNIPADPSTTYANKGWTNWGDWLGTGNVQYGTVSFLPFEEARAFAHKLGFKSQTEWRAYSKSGKKPDYIPTSPYSVYAEKGWTNWGDWLGTSCLPFEEARAFAHKLGLKSQKEWLVYRKSGKRPSSIPTNPNRTYAGKGWTSWGDWLGTGTKTITSDKRLDGDQQAA